MSTPSSHGGTNGPQPISKYFSKNLVGIFQTVPHFEIALFLMQENLEIPIFLFFFPSEPNNGAFVA